MSTSIENVETGLSATICTPPSSKAANLSPASPPATLSKFCTPEDAILDSLCVITGAGAAEGMGAGSATGASLRSMSAGISTAAVSCGASASTLSRAAISCSGCSKSWSSGVSAVWFIMAMPSGKTRSAAKVAPSGIRISIVHVPLFLETMDLRRSLQDIPWAPRAFFCS